MPTTPSSFAVRRPTVDEWGVYDPQQAGLAAVYTRLTKPASAPGPTEAPAPRPDRAAVAAKPSTR